MCAQAQVHSRATTEKFLLQKPYSTFCPTQESKPGPHTQLSRLRPRDQRGSQYTVGNIGRYRGCNDNVNLDIYKQGVFESPPNTYRVHSDL